jgi:predicted RNase H-like nuclease
MTYSKRKRKGREERLQSLGQWFRDLDTIVKSGREQGVPLEDILDATVACWSALRLAVGKGRSLVQPVSPDTTGLPMTIWV